MVNPQHSTVNQVNAPVVHADQVAVENIHAEDASLHLGLVGAVYAQRVTGRRVAVGVIETQTALLSETLALAAHADEMTLKGRAVVLSAENVEAENVYAGGVMAANVSAANIRTGILLGRNVHGPVETLLDTRGALLAGISAGVVTGLVLLVGKLLFRRRK